MASLFFRNAFFTLLQPGIVAGLVPFLIVKGQKIAVPFAVQIVGLIVGFFGLLVMLACIFQFATDGKGTLSPADPTKKLVARGLYRRSRNPMYVGVLAILVAECLFFGSVWLVAYSVFVFLAFQLFVVFREEPRLKRDFGEAYFDYCQKTRRWF